MIDPIPLRPRADDGAAEPRALPANIEAEAAFLGAVLIDNRVIEELPKQLTPDHFFEPVHARIYERLLALLDRMNGLRVRARKRMSPSAEPTNDTRSWSSASARRSPAASRRARRSPS